VGASLALGGAVAAGPPVAGCDRTDHGHDEGHTTVVHAQINGEYREITIDNRMSLLDMLRERDCRERRRAATRARAVRARFWWTDAGATPAWSSQ
jgi:hypothetical protein